MVLDSNPNVMSVTQTVSQSAHEQWSAIRTRKLRVRSCYHIARKNWQKCICRVGREYFHCQSMAESSRKTQRKAKVGTLHRHGTAPGYNSVVALVVLSGSSLCYRLTVPSQESRSSSRSFGPQACQLDFCVFPKWCQSKGASCRSVW